MKCWKCGKEITEADVCLYCGALQERKNPESDYGKALRKIYDDYGNESVFGDSRCITSSLNDLVPESEAFTHSVEYVYHMGLGKLYESQLRNQGKPDENFYKRVKSLIIKEAGFTESKANEIINYFDEMIGWDSSAETGTAISSEIPEDVFNTSVFATEPAKSAPDKKSSETFGKIPQAVPQLPETKKKKSIKPFIFIGAALLTVILFVFVISVIIVSQSKKYSVKSTESPATQSSTKRIRTTADPASIRTFSEKIINFDDMHFYINGKKYTLGQTTLKELIDDGIPYSAGDTDITKKISKAYSFESVLVELGEQWYLFVGVANLTDSEKTIQECPIYRISLWDIEKHYENKLNFAFDFPYNLTLDELLANAGEPDEDDWRHYERANGNYEDEIKYLQDTGYFTARAYTFEFYNGEIQSITMTYMPKKVTQETQESTLKYSGKIINFDEMNFYINGKKYTLGQTTLKELIDDGIPYNAGDTDITKKISKAYSFESVLVVLGERWNLFVGVANLTDSEKTIQECPIYRISVWDIEKHYENKLNFALDFPYNISLGDLLANAGNPKDDLWKHIDRDNGNYEDEIKYLQDTGYFTSRAYTFEFYNGEIKSITMTYMPKS